MIRLIMQRISWSIDYFRAQRKMWPTPRTVSVTVTRSVWAVGVASPPIHLGAGPRRLPLPDLGITVTGVRAPIPTYQCHRSKPSPGEKFPNYQIPQLARFPLNRINVFTNIFGCVRFPKFIVSDHPRFSFPYFMVSLNSVNNNCYQIFIIMFRS